MNNSRGSKGSLSANLSLFHPLDNRRKHTFDNWNARSLLETGRNFTAKDTRVWVGNLSSKVGPVPANLAYTHPPLFTRTSVKRINYRARLLTRYPRIVERTRKRGNIPWEEESVSLANDVKKKRSKDFQAGFFFMLREENIVSISSLNYFISINCRNLTEIFSFFII